MEPKLILLVACTAGALAGPISSRVVRDPASCAAQCIGSSKFLYAAGSTYEYKYETSTRTTMSGAAEDHAGVSVTADVTIEALTSCEMLLTLSSVRVMRSDPQYSRRMIVGDNSGDFQQALEAYPLRFSYQDGVIDQICPELEESTWALNIKRGMLSAFQNSMNDLERDQRVKESDVTGDCYTDYRVTQRGHQSSTITKSKDLMGCANRHGFKTSFHSLPYKTPDALHSLPLLKSAHDCRQIVTREGLLQRSSCSETHVFRPFSKDNNGAMTEASSTLEYKRTLPYVRSRQGQIPSRAALTYEHVYGLRDEDVNRQEASSKLEDLCRLTENDIRPEVPKLFSELVMILKNANYRSLESLYRQIQRQQICSNNNKMGNEFFIDAIPMLGTVDSLRMMRELITSKAVQEKQADMWLTSLAFIQNPTVDMIKEMQPLMDSYHSLKVKLLVAAMVHNFCTKTDDCSQVPIVDRIIRGLESDINRGCVVTDKNHNEILTTLRAIGNIGQAERLAMSLEPCFTREDNPMEIRVAALDAFRRLPCGADRNNAMQVYRNSEADAELRIAAYIVTMQCPAETVLAQVRETLLLEKANQVGSFVWSHLMNLQETSSPLKQKVKKILEDEELSKEFDLEKVKYSRNYEGSLFSEKLNAGGMVESNLIWSSKSFIPRSLMVNLTVDLFGQSLNLFELGGRVEGLESILESVLGPEAGTKESIKKQGYQDTRTIRKEKLDRMKQQYGQGKDDLHASMFLRIFGNELRYMHFDSSNWPLSKDKFNFLEFLLKMSKDHDYTYTNNLIIIDSSIIVPTCTGLPLNLTVHGASTINVKANGKVDLRNVGQRPRSMLIEGLIQPSGAVEITGTMTVDAFVTKTGLKMVTTVHSSTSLKGRMELSRGQIFNLELDMPQDKMEVINVKSSFFIVHDKEEREQNMIQENRKTRKVCWGDRLAKLTGVELCGEVGFPNASMINDSPYFPFTGPVNFGVSLHKRDTHSGYKVVVKSVATRDKVFGQLGFDTPGSSVKRSISVDLAVNFKEKAMEAGLISPWKEATFKSSLSDEPNLKHLKGIVVLDKKDEYRVDAEVKLSRKGDKVTYIPNVELKRKETTTKLLTGSITRKGVEEVEADLVIDTPLTAKSFNLKAGYMNTESEKQVSATLTMSKKEQYSFLVRTVISKVKTSVRVQPTLVISIPKRDIISLKGSGEYRKNKVIKMDGVLEMEKILTKPMRFKSDLIRSENAKKKRLKYKGSVQLSSEFVTLKLTSSLDKKKTSTSTQVALDYSLPKIKRNKVTFSSKIIDKSSKSTKRYKINGNFDVKQNKECNMLADVGIISNSRHKELVMKFRHGENVRDMKNTEKELNLEAAVDHKVSPPGVTANIDYTVKVTYPYKDVNVHAKGHHNHDKKNLASSISVVYGKKQNLNGAFKLRDRSSKKLLSLEGTFELSYPGRDIALVSNLTQKSKSKYLHIINLNLQKGKKSTLVTSYQTPSKNNYKISSEGVLDGYDPVRFDGSASFPSWKNLAVSAKVFRKKDTYGFAGDSQIKDTSGKFQLEVFLPKNKEFTLKASGGENKDRYKADFETAWPSEQGRKPKLTASVSFVNQHGPNKKIGGNFELSCPFESFKGCSGEFEFSNKISEASIKGSAGWGMKKLSATASMDKPLKITNLGLSFAATTPFQGYETLELTAINKFDKSLLTQGKIIFGPHNGQVKVNAEYAIRTLRRDIVAGFEFKSSMRAYKIVSVSMSHHDDGRQFETGVKYNDNGDIYKADFDGTVFINTKINFNGKSKLVVISPNHRITTTLNHEHRPVAIKTVFNTDWGRGKKILVDVTAAYEKILNTKVNGGILIQTPWQPMNDVDVNLSYEQGNGYLKLNSYAKSNRGTLVLLDTNYRRNHGQADIDISVTGSALPDDITGKVNIGEYEGNPKRGHAEFQWAKSKKISMDIYLDLSLDTKSIDTNVRLTTPFEGADDIVVKYVNKKVRRDWVSKLTVEFGLDKYVTAESHLNIDNLRKLRLSVDSSFESMQHFESGLELSGPVKNFRATGDVEMRPAFGKLSGEVSWNLVRDKSMKLRLDTPFRQFRYLQVIGTHQPGRGGKTAHLEIEYHPSKRIELDTTYAIRGITDFTVEASLKTPYPKYRRFETDISFKKPGMAMEGRASVKTPFENFEDVTANFNHALTNKVIQTHADVSYGRGKFEGDLYANWNNGVDGSITLRSPYPGFEMMRGSINHQGDSWTDFSSRSEVQYDNKRIEGNVAFKHGKKTTGSINVRTPFRGYETIKGELSREGQLNDFRVKASITHGPKLYESALQYALKGERFGIASSLKTPWHRDVMIMYNKNGKLRDFTSKGELSYGSDYKLETDVGFKLNNTEFAVRSSLEYLWQGKGRSVGATLVKEGTLNNFNVELGGKYNKKVMHAVATFQKGKISEGRIILTTPFQNYTNPRVTFDYTGNQNRFITNARFNIRDNREYETRMEFLKQGTKRAETSVELKTPHQGHEDYKLEYKHSVRKDKIVVEADLFRGRSKTSSLEFNIDYPSFHRATLNIETPFEGYRRLQASGNYEKRDTLHRVSATANVGKHGTITAETSVDTSGQPYTGEATIRTPFKGYETIRASFSHQGSVRNFRSEATINAPKLSPIHAEASWSQQLDDPTQYSLNGLFTMTSDLKNMEDIRIVMQRSKSGDEIKSRDQVGWQKDKIITLDQVASVRQFPRGYELSMDYAISTPFTSLTSLNFKLDHMHNSEKVAEKISADYNGKSYLDADMDYTFSRRHEGSINIRKPRPMSMSLSGQLEKKQIDANVYLNWNTDEIESNFRLETAYNDRSVRKDIDTDFKLKLIHPVRTMGIEGVVKRLPSSMQNKALITWDQKRGNTFAYDVQWNDRNRLYRQTRDGSIKIVVPMRSVKMSGSYGNSTSVKTLDASFMWDADRDQTKQVVVKLDMDQRGSSVKRSMLLHMPSIKKDYKLETSLVRNQGNTLLDGSTIFSYSPDPRKSLTLSTKLENLGSGRYNNYSMSVGINHPSTYTNLLLNTHMGHSVTSCSGGLVMSYEARNREKKYFVLRGDVNRRDKQIDIEASSPLKHVLLTGRMDKGKPYHVSLTNRYDHTKVVSTDVTVDTEGRTLDVDFAFNSEDPRDSVHLTAGYVNDSALQATVFRKTGFRRISESDIAVHLNTSHILHTRITWRPSATQELQQFVGAKAQVYNYMMNEAASEISQAMGQEVTAKYNKIANEVYTEVEPVFKLLEKELGTAKVNLDVLRRELRRAYKRNDLFIKDMGDSVNAAFNQMFGEFGHFVDAFDRFYIKTERTLTGWLDMVKNYPISEKYMQFVDELVNYLRRARQISDANLKLLGYKMEKVSEDLYRLYLTKSRAFHRKLRELQASILNHPKVKEIRASYNDLRSKVASMPEVDYHRYGQLADELIQRSLEPINMKDTYNQAMGSTRRLIKQQIEAVKKNPDFQKAHSIGNEIYQQLVWAYKYWDLDRNLRETMVRLFQVSRDLVFVELNHLKDSLVDLDKSRIIVYDPVDGELQFELYLPVPLKSLAEPPDFNIHSYIKKVKIFFNRYVPGSNYSIWDTYYKFVPSLDTTTWMPPHRAYAAVVGNQHFITFDKNHFDFAGRCSYVLTRDMVDDNFTVILNYDNNIRAPKKKSMLVMLRGVNIEVAADYKVTVNDRPVELPYTQGKVEATRENHQIIIDDGSGLTVQMDAEHDIYTVILSGWYHGRIAGLLGTLDNEKANDMTSANREKMSDVTAFANSWEVGRRSCRASNRATTINMSEIESAYPACVEYFKAQASHFRQCFSVVSPEEFLHACVGYIQGGKTVDSARCLTAGQYYHQCRTNGVYLQMPKDCVTCDLPEGLEPISGGDAVQLSTAEDEPLVPSSADVILVLEEKTKKQWTPANLGQLITEVDSALQSSGINNNRFGLVGYGGPGSLMTEHSHTFDGQLFSKAKGFLKGVENIVYSSSKFPADGLAALRKATNYPFRAGVAKVLLYIPASECEANKAHVDMDDMLKAHGFTMHILRNKPMDIQDNRSVKNVQVFGMDQGQIITMKERPARNQMLFKNLVHPTDTCALLALATNGSIFDSTHMIEGSARVKRDFVRSFASRVANTASPPMCQTCKCEQDEAGLGKTVCRPCDKASFMWKYMPDWWNSNRTPKFKDGFKSQLKEFLQTPVHSA